MTVLHKKDLGDRLYALYWEPVVVDLSPTGRLELRRLASEASPGLRFIGALDDGTPTIWRTRQGGAERIYDAWCASEQDTAFDAVVHPGLILALLDALDAAETEVARLRALAAAGSS